MHAEMLRVGSGLRLCMTPGSGVASAGGLVGSTGDMGELDIRDVSKKNRRCGGVDGDNIHERIHIL